MAAKTEKRRLPSNVNDYQHLLVTGVSGEDTINWITGLRRDHIKPSLASPSGRPRFKKEDPQVREVTDKLAQSIIDHPSMRRTTGSLGDLIPTANQSQWGYITCLRNNSQMNCTFEEKWDYSPAKIPRHGRFLPQMKGMKANKEKIYKNPKLEFESDFNSASNSSAEYCDRRTCVQFSTDRHLITRNFRVDTNKWEAGLRCIPPPKTTQGRRRRRSTDS